ncbi:RdgB/HAM1 family non-canonical purine NTP pyrophosphatase [Phytoactinopolyspora limicola]|uniref:RdgB/HAM1 family non-canonical purine NTP pyrophosphatase n=1 Tax=Phytoactinopolyspora limicola TaxID=2715536 RepID=UPI00140915F3|nr:RdgB/HAM1 family non-canonical purine NTP pyrophosphatase [Phytoactinopolyspora limicola]
MSAATRKVVLATRNEHKVVEIRRILAEAGLPVDLVGVADFPDVDDVVESGLTFADNALLKARTVAAATGLPALADDSGISVDAMNGMPGVFSGRWCGRHGDDAANLDLLLAQVRDVPDEHRGAAFVCVAAYVEATGKELVQEGRSVGRLIREPRGQGGFGYDPIFVPDGDSRTTAEMTAAEKDAISHRGRAFRLLADQLARTPSP